MLRITEQNENQSTTRIRLDGKLDLEGYAELEALWAGPSADQATTVVLDMTGVVFMSDEAARKLISRRGESFHIVNCSPFVESLLGSVSNENRN